MLQYSGILMVFFTDSLMEMPSLFYCLKQCQLLLKENNIYNNFNELGRKLQIVSFDGLE